MILNPSCSEEVFKLTGSFKVIKDEVLKMLDILEDDERKSTNMKDKENRKYHNEYKKRIVEKRKEVKAVKTLEDFRMIVFPFTCNYETFFKPDNNDLIVATCNNTDWSGIGKESMDVEEYFNIAGYVYYELLCKGDGWIYVHLKYDEKGGLHKPVIFKSKDVIILDKDDTTVKIIKKENLYFYVGQRIEQIELVNKKKLTDDDRKIMNECDKKLVVERLK